MPSPIINTPGSLLPGDIRFYDNYIPKLHDGEYTISVSQVLGNVEGAPPSMDVTQKFAINGPRFTLDPSEIHSSFPPPTHQGKFEEQLPHIVLNKKTLPWERLLDPADDQTPWMALLLFDAGDEATATTAISNGKLTQVIISTPGAGYQIAPTVTISGGGGSGATAIAAIDASGAVSTIKVTNGGSGYTTPPNIKIGSINNAQTVTLNEVITPGNDAQGKPIAAPNITLDPNFDVPTSNCQVIDVSASAFAAVAPHYDPTSKNDELSYTAHVRQVNTANKEPLGMAEADGWFSVIFTKRFPRANGTNPNRQIAHLVSLEGYASKLTGNPDFGQSELVRLVSLASWSFTTLPDEGQTFSELMNDLITTEDNSDYLLKSPYDPPSTPATGALKQAQSSLDLGYVPLSYQTSQGEYTFSWYRGPLSPVVPPVFNDNPTLSSSSEAVIYDPEWGVFDQSYAVAWQTGRLLALSDRSFGINLLKWRREGHQLVNLLIERLPAGDVTSLKTIATDTEAAQNLLEDDIVSSSAMQLILQEFSREIAPNISKPNGQVPQQNQAAPATNSVIEDLKKALEDSDTQALLQSLSGYDSSTTTFSNPRLQSICEWLARLVLLEGVPFKNLVPTDGQLPKESIRFFYIDTNITNAMIDGAMSIGTQIERDSLYYSIMRNVIRDAVSTLIHQVRQKTLGIPITPPPYSDGALSGFLLRSPAVSGWPGLEVKAFESVDTTNPQDPEGTDEIPILRMERLASDILFCLFPKTPAWVQIDEPREGLAFGVEDANEVGLRHVIGNSTGALLSENSNSDRVDLSSFISNNGVIDLLAAKTKMETNPTLKAELDQKIYDQGILSPGDFALQMVKLPERMVFSVQS